ncbi:MAG: 5'/3'-nucleotidase SurE [Bacilli bacterium]|nr:5'/3'-nucleotidase SurE [Bacilli bacterium]
MNILLTNDDGYFATGIQLLKKKLSRYGTVVIVAPNVENSAKSVAITLGKPIKVEKVEKNVFSCSGTPADCVFFGLTNLNMEFDLVVSGCNNGWNISYDTLFSGTIGAALIGLIGRVKSISFSCEKNFPIVDKYFDVVMDFILNNNLLSTEHVLNVNFPLGDTVRGISIGRLYYRHDDYYFVKKEEGFYAMRNCQTDFSDDKNSDCYQVVNGIVSIVPLNKTYFSSDLYDKLKNKVHVNKK